MQSVMNNDIGHAQCAGASLRSRLCAVVGFVALVLSSRSYAGAGLVAHWTFDEGSNTVAYDSSANSNHAAFVGGTTWTNGRTGGSAVAFDGSSGYLEVLTPVMLPITNAPRTVAAWVRWQGEALGHENRYQTIVGYGTPWVNGGTFALERGGDGNLNYLYFTGWNADLRGATASTFQTSSWTHVAATFDGSLLRLYLNGQDDGSAIRSLNTALDPAGLRIGNMLPNDGWHSNFKGDVDDVFIFDRALSQTEIQALMNGIDIRITDLSQNQAGETVLQWQSNLSGLLYAIACCTNLTSSRWLPVEPTNQWPVQRHVWTNTSSPAEYPMLFFRVSGHL